LIAALIAVPLASCQDAEPEGAAQREAAPFERWCEDLGPLATVCSQYKPSANWYLPARIDSVRLDEPLWARDFQQMGQLSLVAGNRTVFIATSTGYLGALDAATGETRWEAIQESFTKRGPEAPVFRELVLTPYSLITGSVIGSRSEIRFYSPATGELQRRHLLPHFQLDALLPTESGEVLAVAENGDIRAFDTATGELVRSEKQLTVLLAAVLAGDRLLLCGRERAVFSLEVEDLKLDSLRMLRELAPWMAYADGGSTLNLVCQTVSGDRHLLMGLDAASLETVWQSEPLEAMVAMLPASIGGKVYYPDTEGAVHCYDPVENAVRWTHRTYARCYVFFTCENAVVVIANYSSTDAQQGSDGGQTRRAPPWYEPGYSQYYRFLLLDPEDGSVRYEHHAPGEFLARTFTESGIVLREGENGPLVCYPADIVIPEANGAGQ